MCLFLAWDATGSRQRRLTSGACPRDDPSWQACDKDELIAQQLEAQLKQEAVRVAKLEKRERKLTEKKLTKGDIAMAEQLAADIENEEAQLRELERKDRLLARQLVKEEGKVRAAPESNRPRSRGCRGRSLFVGLACSSARRYVRGRALCRRSRRCRRRRRSSRAWPRRSMVIATCRCARACSRSSAACARACLTLPTTCSRPAPPRWSPTTRRGPAGYRCVAAQAGSIACDWSADDGP